MHLPPTPSWDALKGLLRCPRRGQPTLHRCLPKSGPSTCTASGLLSPSNFGLHVSQVHFDSSKILALKRNVYGDEHEAYRASFRSHRLVACWTDSSQAALGMFSECQLGARTFLQKYVQPEYAKFEAKGLVDREVYSRMAQEGFYLTLGIPSACGGRGLDWKHNCVVVEEVEDLGCGGLFVNLGNDMVLSYFTESCTDEQRARWLPKLKRGAAPWKNQVQACRVSPCLSVYVIV